MQDGLYASIYGKYLATFNKLRSYNNDVTVLLPNHPPEVDDGLLQAALCRNI